MMNKRNNIGWIIHLAIVIAMYGYYLYLWGDYFFFYDDKAGWRGFDLFIMTIITAPVYILWHTGVYFIAKSHNEKKIMIVSLIGICLCAIHATAVFA